MHFLAICFLVLLWAMPAVAQEGADAEMLIEACTWVRGMVAPSDVADTAKILKICRDDVLSGQNPRRKGILMCGDDTSGTRRFALSMAHAEAFRANRPEAVHALRQIAEHHYDVIDRGSCYDFGVAEFYTHGWAHLCMSLHDQLSGTSVQTGRCDVAAEKARQPAWVSLLAPDGLDGSPSESWPAETKAWLNREILPRFTAYLLSRYPNSDWNAMARELAGGGFSCFRDRCSLEFTHVGFRDRRTTYMCNHRWNVESGANFRDGTPRVSVQMECFYSSANRR